MNQGIYIKDFLFNLVTGIKQKEKGRVIFSFNQFVAEFLKDEFQSLLAVEEGVGSDCHHGDEVVGFFRPHSVSLITGLSLASVPASLQPYLSRCHLHFRRSTPLSILGRAHQSARRLPASLPLPPSHIPQTPMPDAVPSPWSSHVDITPRGTQPAVKDGCATIDPV